MQPPPKACPPDGTILSRDRAHWGMWGTGMSMSIDKALAAARTAEKTGQARQARLILLETHDRFPQNSRITAALAALDQRISGLPPAPFGPPHLQRILSMAGAGRRAEAIEEMVSRVIPNMANPLARNLLGGLYLEEGRPDAAIPHLKAAVAAAPDWREAAVNLATALGKAGRWAESLAAAQAAVRAHPGFGPALAAVARASLATDQPAEAVAALRILVAQAPDDHEARLDLAAALAADGAEDEAMAILDALRARRPEDHRVLTNLGNLHLSQGNLASAEALFRAALAARPNGTNSYNLARAIRIRPDDPALRLVLEMPEQPGLSPEERIAALFAASKAQEDIGQTDAAFAALKAANDLRRSLVPYALDQDARLMDELSLRFAPEAPGLAPARLEPAARRPVFIVGMMRSGTTLAEQILSAHPAVHGAGELDTLGQLVARELAQAGKGPLPQDALMRIRSGYLDALARLPGKQPVVVDKMPANFRFIGLIAKCLPEARILHMQRDPMAVCWSIYKTYFTSGGIGYAWTQEETAGFYRLYEAFMAREAPRYPGLVMHVSYQALTEHPEPVVRAMLDHCGLEFDPACLAPERNRRSVRTASVAQVREGIRQGSSAAWRRFETHLRPMMDVLAEGRAGTGG